MEEVLRKRIVVDEGGRIEIPLLDLPKGTVTEVVVFAEESRPATLLRDLFGSGKGAFNTPREATRFIREERNAWGE